LFWKTKWSCQKQFGDSLDFEERISLFAFLRICKFTNFEGEQDALKLADSEETFIHEALFFSGVI
jgi:hypothetical protein